MGNFDRSKYKATSTKKLQEQKDEVKDLVPKVGNSRAEYINIEDGVNKIRIYPAHPDGDSFAVVKCVHWLPIEVEVDDDRNKGKKKKIIKRLPVFNSKVHGGTKYDIVEEYINMLRKTLKNECASDDEFNEKMKPVIDWKEGILPQVKWVMYAHKIKGTTKEFGRLEISNGLKDKLNEISAADSEDDEESSDPFSDPTDGKAVQITYTKDAKPQDKYKVAILFKGNYELTDDEMEKFEELDSLTKMFKNSYKATDFQKAVDGLRIFDEKNGFGLFEIDEFLDTCEKVGKQYPAEGEEGEKEEEEEEEVTLDTMDRSALKAFIKTNKLGIIVTERMKDANIRDLIREALEASDVESEEGDEDEPTDFVDEGSSKEAEKEIEANLRKESTPALKNKVADLRAGLRKK